MKFGNGVLRAPGGFFTLAVPIWIAEQSLHVDHSPAKWALVGLSPQAGIESPKIVYMSGSIGSVSVRVVSDLVPRPFVSRS